MQEAPSWFGGFMAGLVRGRGRLRGRGAQAEDGEAWVGRVEVLSGGFCPSLCQSGPHLAGDRALVCGVGGCVLLFVPGLEAGGAPLVVPFALICSLQVAMVHGDEQVVALRCRDRPVRGGCGQVGEEACPLRGAEVRYGCRVARADRAWFGPLVGQVGLASLTGGGVG